ncbi:MAG TPA: MBL fold metallo-hydrolase [Candidatus Dormibacteraeota bacterium]|nr:MBL fold metallo-hydrolase [Candidatus Dormibacteraeota bacterium]
MTSEPTVERVLAPNPGPLTGPGTNTWILGSGETLVIDPGPADEQHLARVLAVASRRGRVAVVACTHHHSDHVEGAARFCELAGAPLAVDFRRALEPGTLPLHDGDRLLVGDRALLAVHTPGHASDHLCFFDESSRVLFTGDHVLQGTTSLVLPPDGDMRLYLESLERVLRLHPRRLYPGHGEPIEPAEEAIRELIGHRLERESQILNQLGEGPASPAEIVSRLYVGYPEAVLEMAAGTVLAHLLKLAGEGRVSVSEAPASNRFELAEGPDQD